jgi:hypothetical protein
MPTLLTAAARTVDASLLEFEDEADSQAEQSLMIPYRQLISLPVSQDRVKLVRDLTSKVRSLADATDFIMSGIKSIEDVVKTLPLVDTMFDIQNVINKLEDIVSTLSKPLDKFEPVFDAIQKAVKIFK